MSSPQAGEDSILPPALQVGDTIAILSPSSRLNNIFPLRIARSITSLTALGFKALPIYTPLPSPCTHKQQIKHRVDELHAAFQNPDVKAIMCAIGGLSCNELLPYIDWDIIRNNPKIFCGYSDITLLHHAIFSHTGLRTFYGPSAIMQFGEIPTPLSFTVEHFLCVLSPGKEVGKALGKIPSSEQWTDEFGDWGSEASVLKAREMKKNTGWKWLRPGKCTGRITGGCVPSLVQPSCIKHWPNMSGKILLLETPEGEQVDKPSPLAQTRLLFAELVFLGVFEKIAGLVLGRPMGHSEGEVEAFEAMVMGMLNLVGETFPVLSRVDVGHTDPILTVPLHAMARLDSEEDVWEILEPGVAG